MRESSCFSGCCRGAFLGMLLIYLHYSLAIALLCFLLGIIYLFACGCPMATLVDFGASTGLAMTVYPSIVSVFVLREII